MFGFHKLCSLLDVHIIRLLLAALQVETASGSRPVIFSLHSTAIRPIS